MNFNKHFNLEGRHAYLSPSKHAWTNYDEEKFDRVFLTALAAAKGDRLHKIAHDLIREGIKLPRSQKTLNMYVNDAIGFRMTPEQPLYYSDNFFGCADAVSFRKDVLRISDLKTGITPASIRQLEVYAALFCLEYKVRPFQIRTELRIYQNDEVQEYEGDPDLIFHIMDWGITCDKRIEAMKAEALG